MNAFTRFAGPGSEAGGLQRQTALSALSPRRRSFWRSTSGRFALFQFLLSLVCTLPILFYVYYKVDAILVADFTRPLEFRQSNLEKHYRHGGIRELRAAVSSRAERAHRDQTAILLVDATGRKLAGNLAAWPDGLAAPQAWTPETLHRDGVAHAEAFLVRSVRLSSGHRLLLGGLLDNRSDMHAALLLALAAAFALALPIGLLGSFAMVREMNRMVAAIADIGHHIGAGDLRRRAETDGSGDPMDRLKITLNLMLDRIEALVQEHRTLTDALAHDLRSPLARIHMQLAMLAHPPQGREPAAGVAVVSRELDGVLHILESALEISRAEAGIGRGGFETVDVGAMLRDLLEIFQPLATTVGVEIALRCPPGIFLQGDRVLLARAVSNLIDNGLKYGAEGGAILLEASRRGGDVELSVSDRAGGIPGHRRQDALRKFGRLDDARSTPGSGLGLTLVSAVASLHGGSFELQDNGPGLRATLMLPMHL
ncbi:HAMP domain-containing histidine kinase [Sphingomonas gei]|uniref:histidine kinase n=1 Tax=Sphingomonas gei TaxID=1395960 RepID=A0A4S1XDY7_9SPHN|nr:HAMP domain-containing sensor histidine kinase [Sphingomonas gei]TGX53957.1 HAMP domain-containing histidine kinase [Sphingomonas gei]